MSVIKPRSSTILPIKSSRELIINLFFNGKLKLALESMHYKSQELMCLEWLRSKICPTELRMKYQLVGLGGALQGVDIYGKTIKNKNLYAQVTYNKHKSKLNKKRKSLLTFSQPNSVRIMFANYENDLLMEDGVYEISLKKVWSDLYGSAVYKEFLKQIINIK